MNRVFCEFVHPSSAAAFVFAAVMLSSTIGHCQDPAANEGSQKDRADELYAEFAETAGLLKLMTVAGDDRFQVQTTPLLKFATDATVFGSVYVWHDATDRLATIGTIGCVPIRNIDTEFVELHLLKPEPIQPVTIPGFPPKTWNPVVEDLKLRPVPNAPDVAAVERSRLVQMRTLARGFRAEMKHRDRTNQLRLLPQPLYRYAESTPNRDGAVFAFVWDTGTDPELLLRLESLDVDGTPTWHYQPIRFTWRQLTLKHNASAVWDVDEFQERNAPNQNTPYITGLTRPLP